MSAVKRAVAAALPHPVYRMIRRRRVAGAVRRYPARDVVHTYGGHRLTVHLGDPLAEGWYDRDWPRPTEIELLARLGVLREGALVLDLGAHQGVVALMLAAEVGERGRVVAVEAEPHNAAVARRNAAANGAANLTVVHAAVADRPGTIPFAEGLNGSVDTSTRRGNVEVPAVTIDQLAAEHGMPDLVFLDVEGYEGKALEGAAAALASPTTSFLVEVHAGQLVDVTAAGIVARFASGYDRYVSLDDGAPFTPLAGALPATRFFLAAVRAPSGDPPP